MKHMLLKTRADLVKDHLRNSRPDPQGHECVQGKMCRKLSSRQRATSQRSCFVVSAMTERHQASCSASTNGVMFVKDRVCANLQLYEKLLCSRQDFLRGITLTLASAGGVD